MKYLKILLFVCFLIGSFSVFAEENVPNNDKVIGNVMARDSEAQNVIVADKSSKMLYTGIAAGNGYSVTESYPIVYGENEGDKEKQGDKKTPEGVYYILSWHTPNELLQKYGNFAKIYGSGSFPLNYPNAVDRIRKKTGGGIWIHGEDPELNKTVTQGCISLKNEDLLRLKEKADIKNPVIITDKALFMTKESYLNKRDELFAIFDGFINAWKYGQYKDFEGYIHPEYYGQGKNASLYLSSKKNLMNLYKEKIIENENTKILIQNDDNIFIDTNQFYCAPNLTSYSNKHYYFTKSEGRLKLISEETIPMQGSRFITHKVVDFITIWSEAWMKGDINEYIKFYSNNFRNGKMDKNGWRSYKKAIFEKVSNISLEITNIKYYQKGGSLYEVSFNQRYAGGGIDDYGIKTLVLEGCPGNFKIISESWRKAN